MNKLESFGYGGRAGLTHPGPQDTSADELGLRDYLRQLRRNWQILFGSVVVISAVALLVIFQLTPRYKAQVLLVMEPPKTKVAGIESIHASNPLTSEALHSEKEIIRSRRVARKVVERLKLVRDPEFNGELRNKSPIWTWISKRFAKSGGAELSEAAKRNLANVRVTNSLLKVLDIDAVPKSHLLELSISSPNAEKAARIANTIAEIYLVEQVAAKLNSAERATKWLRERIVKLRLATEQAERAVATYRSKFGLIKGREDKSIVSTQIAELSSQLISARTKRSAVEARLAQVEKMLKSRRGVDSAAEVLSSPIIQRLSERESELIGKLAENSAIYGPKHPTMLALRAEMGDLRRKIRLEVRKIVSRVRGDVAVAKAHEAALQQKLNELEGRVGVSNQKSVKLRALEREAAANRALLESVLARHKEATAQQAIQSANVRIVSLASVPVLPYFPQKMLLGGLAFFGSLMFGIGLIALKENMDVVFRNARQVESVTGLAVLDIVPEVKSRKFSQGEMSKYLKDNQLSPFTEAFRGVHLGLLMSNVDEAPKSILITSSVPEEGKSLAACALAEVITATGARVLVVDCDLRRPSIHEYYGLGKSPGVVEFLSGGAALADVVHHIHDSGPHVITAGRTVSNPSAILASKRMKNLLNTVRENYDFVIIDCAPSLAINDARALGGMVDTMIFAVRWGKVRRDTVAAAVKKLQDSDLNFAGIILNRVDQKKHTLYDNSLYETGSRKYKKYYSY